MARGKCGAARQRATQALEWALDENLQLNIAWAELCIGQADIRLGTAQNQDIAARLDRAILRLRGSGYQDELSRGLIIRADFHTTVGDRAAAESDLDEAWQIAQRGPMRLHMTDIHLARVRLSGNVGELKAARTVMEQCGYWSRKDELEKAETAAKL